MTRVFIIIIIALVVVCIVSNLVWVIIYYSFKVGYEKKENEYLQLSNAFEDLKKGKNLSRQTYDKVQKEAVKKEGIKQKVIFLSKKADLLKDATADFMKEVEFWRNVNILLRQ